MSNQREQAAITAGIHARFADGDEFITELTEDKELIERGIVRVAGRARIDSDGTEADILVEASAIIAGRLVALRQHCGRVYGVSDHDERRAREPRARRAGRRVEAAAMSWSNAVVARWDEHGGRTVRARLRRCDTAGTVGIAP
jgi:hypothetical protein